MKKRSVLEFKRFFLFFVIFLFLLSSTTYSSQAFHGNIKSHVFHRQTCRYYNCRNCTKIFLTRSDALKAGYRPCKICKP